MSPPKVCLGCRSCAVLAVWAGCAAAAAARQPDLSGVWQVSEETQQLKTLEGRTPPLNAEAAKIYAQNEAKWRAGDLSYDTAARCVSPGLPRILSLPYPFKIVQRSWAVLFMFQWNYWNHNVDLTSHPQEVLYPLSLGVSKGHWDGDTLIIDTIGLRFDDLDTTWLDAAGMPHSDSMHLIERLHLNQGGRTLEDHIRIEDPKTFTSPWETVVRFRKLPARTEIPLDVCLDRVAAGEPAVRWSGKAKGGT